MQNNQYKTVIKVLKRLDEAKLLDQMVLVGSWCLYFYQDYFGESALYSMLRTRDVDFLIPVPSDKLPKVDVPALLEDMGFVPSVKADGTVQLMHPEIMLEFLVADSGRGRPAPWPLPQLSMNAQPLRFMHIAEEFPIRIEKDGVKVCLPHPAAFALHKLMVVPRRKEQAKAERDLKAAVSMLSLLLERGDVLALQEIIEWMPNPWLQTVFLVLRNSKEADLLAELKSFSSVE